MLLITGQLILVIVVVLFLFAQLMRRTGMFFPERYPSGSWSQQLPASHEDVHFQTSDGITLHGWLFRPAANAPLLIWFHGNAGNITDRAPIAAELARRGLGVLLFDWRGYGRSNGSPSESGLMLDAVAATGFATRTFPGSAIALYGESLGGPFAAFAASKRRPACVVIENSFPSLLELGNTLYHPLPLGWFAPFALRTSDWLNAAGAPVLVMHGRKDRVIPFALGQQLYDQLRTPKELLVSAESGHSEIPLVDSDRYYSTVVRFVSAHSHRHSS